MHEVRGQIKFTVICCPAVFPTDNPSVESHLLPIYPLHINTPHPTRLTSDYWGPRAIDY